MTAAHPRRTTDDRPERDRPYHPLRVDGDRDAQGPLTLGQANALQWISALTDDHFLGLVQWIFKVPAGTTLERACAA